MFPGFDIQLKILQALPSLVQNYGEVAHGELLRTILDVCSSLQATKTAGVASTAAATFQQIVVSIFERVTEEDGKHLFYFRMHPVQLTELSSI